MNLHAKAFDAQIALANKPKDSGWFIRQTENGWYEVAQRCASCGAAKIRGRCPVAKRDCGRS